jgi:hypothetical protein
MGDSQHRSLDKFRRFGLRPPSRVGECKNVYFLHSPSVGSDGLGDRLKVMQEPLRESKCENKAEATRFCTQILTAQRIHTSRLSLLRSYNPRPVCPIGQINLMLT